MKPLDRLRAIRRSHKRHLPKPSQICPQPAFHILIRNPNRNPVVFASLTPFFEISNLKFGISFVIFVSFYFVVALPDSLAILAPFHALPNKTLQLS
jgi:hypothetical protein